jgi:hypothetical protein
MTPPQLPGHLWRKGTGISLSTQYPRSRTAAGSAAGLGESADIVRWYRAVPSVRAAREFVDPAVLARGGTTPPALP